MIVQTSAHSDWNTILEKIRNLRESLGDPLWFRGHGDTRWKLTTTLLRYVEQHAEALATPVDQDTLSNWLYWMGKEAFVSFERDAWALLSERERTDWGILFAMQHFGLPTRLLDWTESFACAVFFAYQHWRSGSTAAIWVLAPSRLNQRSVGVSGVIRLNDSDSKSTLNTKHWHPLTQRKAKGDKLYNLPTVAVAPVYTNRRMVAQRSMFTLSGYGEKSLDTEFEPDLISTGTLVKIELSPNVFDAVGDFLEMSGLDPFSFFPDLEGLKLRHHANTMKNISKAKKQFPGAFKP